MPGKDAGHHEVKIGLILIGLYDIVKGSLILALALGILRLIHRDVESVARLWLRVLHADPDNRFIHALLVKTHAVTPRQLEWASAGSLFYAILHYAEGIGLMLRKRWAEYLAVVATGAFIPVEIYELFHHFHGYKLAIVTFNAGCVWYVGKQLRRHPALDADC